MRPRDAQGRRVYAWEAAWDWYDRERFPFIPITQAERVIARACSTGPRPYVIVVRGCTAWYADDNILALPAGRTTKPSALHETAHHLTPDHYAWHGPEFVATYIDLLVRFRVAKRADLRALAKIHRVKEAP